MEGLCYAREEAASSPLLHHSPSSFVLQEELEQALHMQAEEHRRQAEQQRPQQQGPSQQLQSPQQPDQPQQPHQPQGEAGSGLPTPMTTQTEPIMQLQQEEGSLSVVVGEGPLPAVQSISVEPSPSAPAQQPQQPSSTPPPAAQRHSGEAGPGPMGSSSSEQGCDGGERGVRLEASTPQPHISTPEPASQPAAQQVGAPVATDAALTEEEAELLLTEAQAQMRTPPKQGKGRQPRAGLWGWLSGRSEERVIV